MRMMDSFTVNRDTDIELFSSIQLFTMTHNCQTMAGETSNGSYSSEKGPNHLTSSGSDRCTHRMITIVTSSILDSITVVVEISFLLIFFGKHSFYS